MKKIDKVSIIGLGYIGLPTAAVIASKGMDVAGVDNNTSVVQTINEGRIHIVEPDLATLVRRVVKQGKLRASATPVPADIFIIAVPTQLNAQNIPDFSLVMRACDDISPVLKKGDVILVESTSPVGATESFAARLQELRPDLSFPPAAGENADINIAYCPERVLPGRILRELAENDRIIGGLSRRCSERAAAFYKTFVNGKCLTTDARTAELTKLTENSFRDVNIAFANELSLICDRLNIDVWELIELANHHPRVKILQPGPGVGGHCVAVNPWFIIHSAPDQARLIRTAREINDEKTRCVAEKARELIGKRRGVPIALFGLSFKPDIDDLRGSPAIEIAKLLAHDGSSKVLVVEPYISALPKVLAAYDNIELANIPDALARAEAVVLLVKHRAFLKIDRNALKNKAVLDVTGGWR